MSETDPYFFTIETAYWKWLDENCPDKGNKEKRRQWLRDNPFPFDGKLWTRSASGMRSNSGKTITGWDIDFVAHDGARVVKRVDPNRRNDSERNWGLGRD